MMLPKQGAGVLSRGVGLRGFESHPPHHVFDPHNFSEILRVAYLKNRIRVGWEKTRKTSD